MNPPSPAIVTATAARPLARGVLVLLCLAYLLPGFIARDPWRNADMATLGYSLALTQEGGAWLAPALAGIPAPSGDGLLAYWLGALALQYLPAGLAPDIALRLPFMALLALTLAATWWAMHALSRSPGAQPVAFAFGGEAAPADYAHALADSALLALIACLGLAQRSHEAGSSLVQLSGTTLLLFAAAASPYRPRTALLTLPIALLGLTLGGAPTLALALGLGVAVLGPGRLWAMVTGVSLVACAALAWALGLWAWHIEWPQDWGIYVIAQLRMLVWFGWPAWPLALWTLWRWRRQLLSRPLQRHLWLPLWFTLVLTLAAWLTSPSDRSLLLALPALAMLAAFALPTLQRSVSALIDWFTLLFFSLCAVAIWVVWLSVQTGFPAQPAANIARLAPGFVYTPSWLALAVALLATVAWCLLVRWRSARHRAALWKSLILPASGATLAWLLLMTIWMPMLNYARSDAPQVRNVLLSLGDAPGCVLMHGLDDSQMAALQYHGHLELRPYDSAQAPDCRWLAAASDSAAIPAGIAAPQEWLLHAAIGRPTNRHERIMLLRRVN